MTTDNRSTGSTRTTSGNVKKAAKPGMLSLFSKKSQKQSDAASKKANLRANRRRILTENSPYAQREAYTQLRTNLLFSVAAASANSDCRIFAVTSSNPGEGKSLTAANIAVSFAMLGKRTLLIDADMRKPTQHRLWKVAPKNGLSNLLTNVNRCYISEVEGLPLNIITAGEIPPNPSELLASPRFQKSLDHFRDKYDFIIIDTPPVNAVADAQLVSQLADAVVLVVRSSVTKKDDVLRAEQNIMMAGGKIAGIVLNAQNAKSAKYSYRYQKDYYSYSYDYKNE